MHPFFFLITISTRIQTQVSRTIKKNIANRQNIKIVIATIPSPRVKCNRQANQMYEIKAFFCFIWFGFLFGSHISLIANGPQRARLPTPPRDDNKLQLCHPACAHQGSSRLSPVLLTLTLSRSKFSPLTTRRPIMAEFCLIFSCSTEATKYSV